MAKKFKKLEVELPRQPLSDQRVWQLAGLVFAFLILIFTLYTYLDYRNDSGSFQQQMDINNVEIR
jgi:hypothetical protein